MQVTTSFIGNNPAFPTLSALPTPQRYSTFELPGWDEDLFSTDVPMPSSPPATFSLYEDLDEPTSGLWTDYNIPSSPQLNVMPGTEDSLEGCLADIRVPTSDLGSSVEVGEDGKATLTVDLETLMWSTGNGEARV